MLICTCILKNIDFVDAKLKHAKNIFFIQGKKKIPSTTRFHDNNFISKIFEIVHNKCLK